MSFTPKTWANDVDGATPITAEELNRIELGIDQGYGQSAASLANNTVATIETVIATFNIQQVSHVKRICWKIKM